MNTLEQIQRRLDQIHSREKALKAELSDLIEEKKELYLAQGNLTLKPYGLRIESLITLTPEAINIIAANNRGDAGPWRVGETVRLTDADPNRGDFRIMENQEYAGYTVGGLPLRLLFDMRPQVLEGAGADHE